MTLSRIIVFSGIDGSGKSTHVKNLAREFKKQKLKTKCIWARGGYTPLFSLVKKFLRFVMPNKIPVAGNSNLRNQYFKKKYIAKIWLSLATIDLLLFYALYLRINSWISHVVICDRYVEDTLIDFKRNFPSTFSEHSFLWRLLVLLTPRPNQCFLLYVPIKVSLARSNKKNEPFPDTPDTLEFRLSYYQNETIFPTDKYHRINCEQSIENVRLEIVNKFKDLF